MLSFFRKARHSLTNSAKSSNYFFYAFGEVALVVVGILIALQINNWNESRKESRLEFEILNGILNDLENNEIKLKAMIKGDSLVISFNQYLQELLNDKNSKYHDSLTGYFGNMNRYDIFYPQRMSFETLKSKGLHTIKNETVRAAIIELYDETYFLNYHIIELKNQLYVGSIDLVNKRFLTLNQVALKVPNNFELLKEDTEYINALSHITAEKQNFLMISKNILVATVAVKNDVYSEIERLKT